MTNITKVADRQEDPTEEIRAVLRNDADVEAYLICMGGMTFLQVRSQSTIGEMDLFFEIAELKDLRDLLATFLDETLKEV